MTPETLSPIMTVKEVAAHLRVHISSIYRLLKRGEIPAFKTGSDWRFRTDEINKWTAGLTNGRAGK